MASSNTTAVTAPKKPRGGVRAGAGRKIKNPVTIEPDADAIAFLKACYLSGEVPMPLRIRAASVIITATVARPAQPEKIGKKAQRLIEAAEAVKPGMTFAPGRPPLAVVARTAQNSGG